MDNDIEINSTHNKQKSVVAERFIRMLKNNIYKYMTSISKNFHIYKLDNSFNSIRYCYVKGVIFQNHIPTEITKFELNQLSQKVNQICLIHATKSELKDKKDVDTSKFAKKTNLASLKSDYDRFELINQKLLLLM